ncbi:MAG: hypothetical protein JWN99_89, partial [Ilumatobacteraceae bacterium]|nr:hypothetical protein [Ilumatobacteraceae bacterium]
MSGLLSPAGVRTCLAATSPRSAESDLTALVLDIRPRLWFSFA